MTRETIYRIALKAGCDPRTVAKWADGGSLRVLVRERIEAAKRAVDAEDATPIFGSAPRRKAKR